MSGEFDRNGAPKFIYGTAWKEETTEALTAMALRCGFRGIDTANQRKHYFEAGVGRALSSAIEDQVVERDEVFLQTKFTYLAGQDERLPYDRDAPFARQVEQSLASSLEHLQTDYVDAYLLHGPSTRAGLAEADRQVWEKMQALKDSEQVGAIGISNVTSQQLETLIDWADVAPAFVQNRCFAQAGWDRAVRRICADNDIVYQGFSLLTANGRALNSPTIAAIARRYDRTVAQVVFRFAMQIGMVPLTGTTSEHHMRQDLACVEFALDEAELESIERIVTG